MANLIPERLAPGMILAEDVVDMAGGCCCVPVLNSAMKTWGVTNVRVEGGEADLTAVVDLAQLAVAEEEIRLRFRHCDLGHGVMQYLADSGRAWNR